MSLPIFDSPASVVTMDARVGEKPRVAVRVSQDLTLYRPPTPQKNTSGRTRRIAGVILAVADHILCVQQAYSNLWGLPKGGVEPDELASIAAIRELYEETGVVIQESQLGAKYGLSRATFYMVTLQERPNIGIDHAEIKNAAWLTPQQLSERGISSVTRKLLPRIQRSMMAPPRV